MKSVVRISETVSIDGISAITEENSSSAEEMAATAEELSAQAQRMQGLVSKFQLNYDAGFSSAGGMGSPASSAPKKPVKDTL